MPERSRSSSANDDSASRTDDDGPETSTASAESTGASAESTDTSAESTGASAESTDTSAESTDASAKAISTRSASGRSHPSPPTAAPPPDDEFGWRGWVLVGAAVLSFLVVPWAIILLPRAQGLLTSLGLGLRDAYLVLPLVPAIGLAVVAVWAAVADRRDGS